MGGVRAWVEAMRLRTLPVSVAGVVTACGLAVASGHFSAVPALLCLAFAVLAQIASNFANEYYDYKAGLDRVGRDGPRRGVTEGDITPRAMLCATFATLALAAVIGCGLIYYGGWWLLGAGVAIAVGALAYSAGPYPLSRHGWGEVAVVLFFGLVPVSLTYYVQALCCPMQVIVAGAGVGLMGANVLIVNNYRDRDDDLAVGKLTLAVRLGRPAMLILYGFNVVAGAALMVPAWMLTASALWSVVPALYVVASLAILRQLSLRRGAAINPLLGMTAMAMLVHALLYLASAIAQ